MTGATDRLAPADLSRLVNVPLTAASPVVPLLEPDPAPGSHNARNVRTLSCTRGLVKYNVLCIINLLPPKEKTGVKEGGMLIEMESGEGHGSVEYPSM
jgi:hypothetical protein